MDIGPEPELHCMTKHCMTLSSPIRRSELRATPCPGCLSADAPLLVQITGQSSGRHDGDDSWSETHSFCLSSSSSSSLSLSPSSSSLSFFLFIVSPSSSSLSLFIIVSLPLHHHCYGSSLSPSSSSSSLFLFIIVSLPLPRRLSPSSSLSLSLYIIIFPSFSTSSSLSLFFIIISLPLPLSLSFFIIFYLKNSVTFSPSLEDMAIFRSLSHTHSISLTLFSILTTLFSEMFPFLYPFHLIVIPSHILTVSLALALVNCHIFGFAVPIYILSHVYLVCFSGVFLLPDRDLSCQSAVMEKVLNCHT